MDMCIVKSNLPIGDQIVTSLSDATPSGAGNPRSRPTMRHVAALAGVGVKTVSRVINGEPNVSAATIA